MQASFSGCGMDAAGSHNGYDHLPGRPRHFRHISVRDGAALRVQDRVEGKGRHCMEGGFLLAPEWTVTAADGGWILAGGPHTLQLTVCGPERLQRRHERVAYHPEYGREVQSSRLSWRLDTTPPVEVIVLIERLPRSMAMIRILYVSQYFPPEIGTRPRKVSNSRGNGSGRDIR